MRRPKHRDRREPGTPTSAHPIQTSTSRTDAPNLNAQASNLRLATSNPLAPTPDRQLPPSKRRLPTRDRLPQGGSDPFLLPLVHRDAAGWGLCARSRKRTPDVGSDPAHPDLSARDAAVVG